MSENTDRNHIIENKEEIALKALLDKSDNIYPQTKPVNNEYNMASCFAYYETGRHHE